MNYEPDPIRPRYRLHGRHYQPAAFAVTPMMILKLRFWELRARMARFNEWDRQYRNVMAVIVRARELCEAHDATPSPQFPSEALAIMRALQQVANENPRAIDDTLRETIADRIKLLEMKTADL